MGEKSKKKMEKKERTPEDIFSLFQTENMAKRTMKKKERTPEKRRRTLDKK